MFLEDEERNGGIKNTDFKVRGKKKNKKPSNITKCNIKTDI